MIEPKPIGSGYRVPLFPSQESVRYVALSFREMLKARTMKEWLSRQESESASI